MKRQVCSLAACLLLVGVRALASDLDDIESSNTVISTNNSVIGSVTGLATWDGGDQLRIQGQLHQLEAGCAVGNALTNYDSVIVVLVPKDGSLGGSGYGFCEAPHQRRAFSPGTDNAGNFDITIQGWGVGWVTGDGTSYLGADIVLLFKEPAASSPWNLVALYCGHTTEFGAFFPCDYAPAIYDTLASPDLTGTDGTVDNADFTSFGYYFYGRPVTINSGWQADFNHDGFCDFSDLVYIAGRLGVNGTCASSKPTEARYAMNVRNLELQVVADKLEELGFAPADVIARWDQMGLSYDHSAAQDLLAGRTTTVEARPWWAVKILYR